MKFYQTNNVRSHFGSSAYNCLVQRKSVSCKVNRLNFTHKDKASTHAFLIYQLHRQFKKKVQERKYHTKDLIWWRHIRAKMLWCREWERKRVKQFSFHKQEPLTEAIGGIKETHSFAIYGKISILCTHQKCTMQAYLFSLLLHCFCAMPFPGYSFIIIEQTWWY